MTETLRDLVRLRIVVNANYDQNCYVVERRDTRAALVFDPGLQHPEVLRILDEEGLRCERIYLTHGHGDHINGVPAVKAAHGCEAAIHPDDREQLPAVHYFPGIDPALPDVECEVDLEDGQRIEWQGLQIDVLHTPGHTRGSVCFLIGDGRLIAGDTLFRRGVGRADLPGGDWQALLFSIENRLYTLPPETVVHPGHGEATTVGEEMSGNPFVVHPRYR